MIMPLLDVLQAQNIYTGSEGAFRYKVKPEGGNMTVWAYKDYCLEYCQAHGLMLGEETFPLDEDGFSQMKAWLEEKAK